MKKLIIGIITGAMLITSVTGCSKEGSKDNIKPKEEIFTNLDTKDIKGNVVTKDEFKNNELTMLNVWTTWCGPCVGEMPELNKLAKEMESKGVNVMGIVLETDNTGIREGLSNKELNSVEEILKSTGAEYTQLTASKDLLETSFKRIMEFPTTFFVDKNGKLVGDKVSGGNDKEGWTKIVEERLEMVK